MSGEFRGSFPKDQGPCECGTPRCDAWGTYRVKPWSNGKRCVRTGCPCPRCSGKRSRSKGDAKASKVRRALAATGARTRHEEGWGGALRIESKAGAQVGPILTRYIAAKNQSEASRPIGDNRPFVMAASPDRGPVLLILELDELEQVVAAVAENWGLIA